MGDLVAGWALDTLLLPLFTDLSLSGCFRPVPSLKLQISQMSQTGHGRADP